MKPAAPLLPRSRNARRAQDDDRKVRKVPTGRSWPARTVNERHGGGESPCSGPPPVAKKGGANLAELAYLQAMRAARQNATLDKRPAAALAVAAAGAVGLLALVAAAPARAQAPQPPGGNDIAAGFDVGSAAAPPAAEVGVGVSAGAAVGTDAPVDAQEGTTLIPPYAEGAAYAAPGGSYCFAGPHPVDTRTAPGPAWEESQGQHLHPYPPLDLRLFTFHDGCYYFIGDPRDFGYGGRTYSYYGAHPVLDVYGGGWCFMMGGHTHLWAPWSASFTVVGPWYYWHGPYDPFFWTYWPYYSHYYRLYYPHYYGGGRFYRGGWQVAPPIRAVPAPTWRPPGTRGWTGARPPTAAPPLRGVAAPSPAPTPQTMRGAAVPGTGSGSWHGPATPAPAAPWRGQAPGGSAMPWRGNAAPAPGYRPPSSPAPSFRPSPAPSFRPSPAPSFHPPSGGGVRPSFSPPARSFSPAPSHGGSAPRMGGGGFRR